MRYGLIQSFDIDHGGLRAGSMEEAFTLGVEWGAAWEQAKSPAPFTIVVHASNAERICTMVVEQGRRLARPGRALGDYTEISILGLD